MIIKYKNMVGEMTSSCLKCGHSAPAVDVRAMIDHIKNKHENKPDNYKPGPKSKKISNSTKDKLPTTSKTEPTSIMDRLNQLLADDDDLPVSKANSSNTGEDFLQKFDDESDELDRLLNSVSDDH